MIINKKQTKNLKHRKINEIFQIIYSEITTYGDCKEFEKRTNFCYFCIVISTSF